MNRDFTQLKPWVHKSDAKKIRDLVKAGEYVSVSEFCRKAIRKQLIREEQHRRGFRLKDA